MMNLLNNLANAFWIGLAVGVLLVIVAVIIGRKRARRSEEEKRRQERDKMTDSGSDAAHV